MQHARLALPLSALLSALPALLPAQDLAAGLVTDPIREAEEMIEGACGEMGGTVTYGEGFIARPDLNGDGTADIVLDYGAAVCDEARSYWCGSAGCVIDGYLTQEDGYVNLFNSNLRAWEITEDGLFRVILHGNACGGFGYDNCLLDFRIEGTHMQAIGEPRMMDRTDG